MENYIKYLAIYVYIIIMYYIISKTKTTNVKEYLVYYVVYGIIVSFIYYLILIHSKPLFSSIIGYILSIVPIVIFIFFKKKQRKSVTDYVISVIPSGAMVQMVHDIVYNKNLKFNFISGSIYNYQINNLHIKLYNFIIYVAITALILGLWIEARDRRVIINMILFFLIVASLVLGVYAFIIANSKNIDIDLTNIAKIMKKAKYIDGLFIVTYISAIYAENRSLIIKSKKKKCNLSEPYMSIKYYKKLKQINKEHGMYEALKYEIDVKKKIFNCI